MALAISSSNFSLLNFFEFELDGNMLRQANRRCSRIYKRLCINGLKLRESWIGELDVGMNVSHRTQDSENRMGCHPLQG